MEPPGHVVEGVPVEGGVLLPREQHPLGGEWGSHVVSESSVSGVVYVQYLMLIGGWVHWHKQIILAKQRICGGFQREFLINGFE